ncbi:MAG: hypothetical protein QOF02_3371 [Blastocatellia bacterium]|jgi:hypothetical protein|nr:hypothetical protein [Blastocatellia bacterium]
MKSRSIITSLLVCAMALTTAAARTPNAFERARFQTEDEPQLSSKERREALDLLARFDRRLKETNDFGQIIDEFFVNDLAERARQAPLDTMPWWFVDKSLVTTADTVELRRYYVATLNFFQLLNRVWDVLRRAAREQAGDAEANVDVDIYDALTPEIMTVLRSDPTIATLIKELEKDEEVHGTKEDDSSQPAASVDSSQAAGATAQADGDAGDDTSAEENERGVIKSLAQLKDVSATLERAVELLRQRLASLSLNSNVAPANADAKDEPGVENLNLTTVKENFYGYTKGSQVIHADLLPFCLTMTRQDGQLKILSVTIYID